jgi:hypothetical protein
MGAGPRSPGAAPLPFPSPASTASSLRDPPSTREAREGCRELHVEKAHVSALGVWIVEPTPRRAPTFALAARWTDPRQPASFAGTPSDGPQPPLASARGRQDPRHHVPPLRPADDPEMGPNRTEVHAPTARAGRSSCSARTRSRSRPGRRGRAARSGQLTGRSPGAGLRGASIRPRG